jgi:hypothetical protein
MRFELGKPLRFGIALAGILSIKTKAFAPRDLIERIFFTVTNIQHYINHNDIQLHIYHEKDSSE